MTLKVDVVILKARALPEKGVGVAHAEEARKTNKLVISLAEILNLSHKDYNEVHERPN